MERFLITIKSINRYIYAHKVFLLLLAIYYANILGISLLNGNYVCRENVCGLGIVGSLFHDPIWHAALAALGFNSVPFRMPVLSEMPLNGYHFLFDFLMSLIARLGFDTLFVYYKIIPHLFFILFVYVGFYYALKLNKSPLFVFSYIFFLFFGGTLSFVPYFIHNGTLLGANDMLLQLNTLGLSPNVGFSFIIFLAALIITQNKKITQWGWVLLNFFLFLEMGMKFYAGLVLFIFLNLFNVLFYLKKQTLKKFLIHAFSFSLTFGIAVLVFYNPFAVLKSGFVFLLTPFELVHPMIESPEMYPIQSLVLMRYSLIQSQIFSVRLLFIELVSTALFLFHYLGVFNIGLAYIFWHIIKRSITRLEVAFFLCYIFTVIMAVFFTQRGYYNDTMQFLFYGMLFMVYFNAKTILMLQRLKKPFFYILLMLILIISIPNNISAMMIPYDTQRIIPSYEIEALNYLKKQPDGIIATSQVDDSAYVPLLTHKFVYIADIQQLEITHVDYKARKKQIENLDTIDPSVLPVQYFYILKSHPKFKKISKRFSTQKFKNIYENKMTVIYKKLEK